MASLKMAFMSWKRQLFNAMPMKIARDVIFTSSYYQELIVQNKSLNPDCAVVGKFLFKDRFKIILLKLPF